jgi:GxxExxY protein
MIELRRSGLNFEYIKRLPVEYDGHVLGEQEVRLILVDGRVLLATFAVREANAAMAEQLKARMRRLDIKLGLLANFYDTRLVVTPVRIK